MWGTRKSPPYPRQWVWFIPTHVGNSNFADLPLNEEMVHPHACGELNSVEGM